MNSPPRPWSPSVLHGIFINFIFHFSIPPLTSFLEDVDVPAHPRPSNLPPPPSGHDLMRMFPAPSPATRPPAPGSPRGLPAPTPTSGWFERQEHAFFAKAGKEIVRVRKDGENASSSNASMKSPTSSGPMPFAAYQNHVPPPQHALPPASAPLVSAGSPSECHPSPHARLAAPAPAASPAPGRSYGQPPLYAPTPALWWAGTTLVPRHKAHPAHRGHSLRLGAIELLAALPRAYHAPPWSVLALACPWRSSPPLALRSLERLLPSFAPGLALPVPRLFVLHHHP